MLNDDQLLRYSRQLMVEQVDLDGQEALTAARVLLVGCGGLASPAALYLGGAGVGCLVLVDDDQVELSNLHRQVAFTQADLGTGKAEALARQLQQRNEDIQVEVHGCRADQRWLDQQIAQASLVLDCSDNFATRQAVNRACVANRVPLVSGAAIGMDGQLAVFDYRQGSSPCYACLYGPGTEGDLACSAAGVVGPVVGTVGTLQALAAINLLCGHTLPATLRLFDGRTLSWRELQLSADPECGVCSRKKL